MRSILTEPWAAIGKEAPVDLGLWSHLPGRFEVRSGRGRTERPSMSVHQWEGPLLSQEPRWRGRGGPCFSAAGHFNMPVIYLFFKNGIGAEFIIILVM